ncbi:Bifunctional P-450:NADPH-P450 reductase [Cordyceps fumosorosea ARSEF 2679]|uniref:Bifunctional cytochrome P450/NADPH--P450 reductase n=1 Tax=Cordyceps fumosorosea (strain ARSEF 2679) TaxID=1081104 RepID=A0A168APA8_CORFA|nr:Bifunctional P-450:NADPH-P450 reductase [Cordyceps fumosorosea ARSEF 2679]OAA69010.1 Bifunctional P-450:NADPH-P450 reductase [Cordyceps fumosorosea ARSEF 2679]
MAESIPIPEPPGLPFIGNLGEMRTSPINDLKRLADTYGEIYRLRLGGSSFCVVNSRELVNDACDERRFKKTVAGTLGKVRAGVHDGLFTADSETEPNWGKAHRILIPAFGPLSIRNMFDEMHDIASQMAMKFARHTGDRINASDDFTRLALDTIALCAMDYRFNSYYHEELHPFIRAMGDFLKESGARNRRPAFAPQFFYRAVDEKYEQDIKTMRDVADEVVANRKKNPSNRKDLLTAMLDGKDPQDGQRLTDASITDQLITFLIAGHETTSGMLSFTFYQLLKHPSEYRKVREEVDAVVGRERITVEHISKLTYTQAVLREVLRLNAPIPAFSVEAKEDTLLGGKYFIPKEHRLTLLLAKSHLDPAVYGDDASDFKPERMLDDSFARLNKEFPNAWKPFGNGKRACIGRPFAWQEAVLAMAILFQNFNFTLDDPNYTLEMQETLTVKPHNFYMRASLRHGMTATELEDQLKGNSPHSKPTKTAESSNGAATATNGKPMSVFYGSNSGTCEALAQRVAADAGSHGFAVTEIGPLDNVKDKLPTDRPVVIVTASYEGEPPSNAAHFVDWLRSLKGNELQNVSYAVFGCGHHDWAQTFHKIPKLVDATMAERGADRILPMTGTDAADRDMFSDFETWEDESLWPALKKKYGAKDTEDGKGTSGLKVEITHPRKTTLRQDVEEAAVIETKVLTKGEQAVKKHIEIRLPTGMSYKAGDYLAVLPFNPAATVGRVFRRFSLSWDATFTITANGPTTLPTGVPISATNVLGAYVELSQPATKRSIQAMIDATEDEKTVAELKSLIGDKFSEEVTAKRRSALDLLEKFPAVGLLFETFLAMLPPMRVRQYSISSSPLVDPTRVTLTYSLLDVPAHSGQGQHVGVASHYLASLREGDKIHVAIRPSAAFHLPADAEKTPIICMAAGTGLAPFRGFAEERAAMITAGRKLAPAVLFFGCRSPDSDDLYAEQFTEWQNMGAIDVRRAYSRATDKSDGCKYVQDRISKDREEIFDLWDQGARLYLCGSRAVGKGIEDICVDMVKESGQRNKSRNVTDEAARAWLDKMRNERFMADVFD